MPRQICNHRLFYSTPRGCEYVRGLAGYKVLELDRGAGSGRPDRHSHGRSRPLKVEIAPELEVTIPADMAVQDTDTMQ